MFPAVHILKGCLYPWVNPCQSKVLFIAHWHQYTATDTNDHIQNNSACFKMLISNNKYAMEKEVNGWKWSNLSNYQKEWTTWFLQYHWNEITNTSLVNNNNSVQKVILILIIIYIFCVHNLCMKCFMIWHFIMSLHWFQAVLFDDFIAEQFDRHLGNSDTKTRQISKQLKNVNLIISNSRF